MLPLGAVSSNAESSLTRPLVFSDSQLLEPVGKWELPLREQWAQLMHMLIMLMREHLVHLKEGSKLSVWAPQHLQKEWGATKI